MTTPPTPPSDRTEPSEADTLLACRIVAECLEAVDPDASQLEAFARLDIAAHVASVCREKDAETVAHITRLRGELAALKQSILDLSHPNCKTLLADLAARDRRIAELEGEAKKINDFAACAVHLGDPDREPASVVIEREWRRRVDEAQRMRRELTHLRATLLATQTALEQAKVDTVRLDWLDAHSRRGDTNRWIEFAVPHWMDTRAAIDAASAQPKQEGAT